MMYHVSDLSDYRLPGSVHDLVVVVGLSAALAIVEARGGIRLCVPKRATQNHWLAKLIGIDALASLVSVYAGEEIDVPRCYAALRQARDLQIVAEAVAGASNAELARRHHYTERGIRKLRRRVEREIESPQADLFAVDDSTL